MLRTLARWWARRAYIWNQEREGATEDLHAVSQEELAARAGYHRTYIGQLERGEKSPSLRTIFNLCSTLQVNPSVLIRRVERLV